MIQGDDGVKDTYHIGIKSAEDRGIILDAATNMALRSSGGIYLTVGTNLYLNNKPIDGIARFG